MLENILSYIKCLNCQEDLELTTFSKFSDLEKTKSGYLLCKCGESYPIINGVARILSPDMMSKLIFKHYVSFFEKYLDKLPIKLANNWKSDNKYNLYLKNLKISTASSFGFEWKVFNKMFDQYKQNFLNYTQPFKEDFFKDRIVLDAGCGVGRHTYWSAKFGAKEVIGIDMSDAVDPAEGNCRELSNVTIIQADIYNLPFKQMFDFIFSIGVLHHLPNPEEGFKKLTSFLKLRALMLIWVYGRKDNNTAVYFYEPLRTITRHINKKLLIYICYPFALAVEMLNQLSNVLDKFNTTKKAAKIIPYQYYRNFPFEVKLNDAFDVLATPKSRYYYKDEIFNWYKNAGLLNPKLSYLRKKSIIAYDFKK